MLKYQLAKTKQLKWKKLYTFLFRFQFDNLWNLQKVNDFGNLDYHEFMRKYCIEPRKPQTPLVTSRPGTMMSGRQSMLSRVRNDRFLKLDFRELNLKEDLKSGCVFYQIKSKKMITFWVFSFRTKLYSYYLCFRTILILKVSMQCPNKYSDTFLKCHNST